MSNGRPRRMEKEPTDQMVRFKVAASEKQEIMQYARTNELSLSQAVRDLVLTGIDELSTT